MTGQVTVNNRYGAALLVAAAAVFTADVTVLRFLDPEVPFALIIFFAGLQMLPRELIDAASIDGANRLQQIRHIVIPHLRSLFLLNAILAVMDFLRLFDNVFVLTRMNPIFHADTMQTYLYRIAMTVRRLGLANAGAVLTVVIIMVVLIPFLIFMYHEQIEER